nr:unnamed protein product [Callosobruchus chinensis]
MCAYLAPMFAHNCALLCAHTHVDYKNRNKKYDATQELAEIFKCDSTELSTEERRKKLQIQKLLFLELHLNFLHGRDEVNASINSLDEINEQLSEDHSTFTENETQASNPEVQPFKAPKHSMKRRPVVEDPRIAHALSIMDNVKKRGK